MKQVVSRETEGLLNRYIAVLLAWNRRINLVGSQDKREIRRRHIDDCVQLCELLAPGCGTVVDLGSGAGLPGLVISICRPDVRVVCIDSDTRKVAFLRETIRILGLNAEARAGRIEAIEPLAAPVVTARALAPLPLLLAHVARHLSTGGTALLMKGRNWQEELEQAAAAWQFSFEAASSRTDPNAVILSIGGLTRA